LFLKNAASLSDNGVCHIDEVSLRRPRLVRGWVTVRRFATLNCQLSLLPSAGWENERRPKCSDALRLGADQTWLINQLVNECLRPMQVSLVNGHRILAALHRVFHTSQLPSSYSTCSRYIGNDSVQIQLAQCWFPRLAIFNAKI